MKGKSEMNVCARDVQPGTVIRHPGYDGVPYTVQSVDYSPHGGGQATVHFREPNAVSHTFSASDSLWAIQAIR
jgi:translation elongation factor P/translation initiation factor 5A